MAQTLTDWELIVCDSYSDDGSWEYLQQFADDERVKLYQVPKEGLYAGWNECLERAIGEYVYIATMDDTCEPDFLERMVEALGKAEGGKPKVEGDNLSRQRPVDVAVCGLDIIDEDGKLVLDHSLVRWPKKLYGSWMETPHLRDGATEFILHACLGIIWGSITAVMFRRSLLGRIGFFRTDRGSQADEEWEMRASLASDIVYVPEKLATWRVHGKQATSNLKPMNRTNLDCLESVLNDSSAGIPDEWKNRPGWKEKITHICRTEYQDSLGLYRNVLRHAPKNFLHGAWEAAKSESGFLLRQVLRGFAWSSDFSPDPFAQARELIELFECEWPPKGVKGRT